MSRLLCSLSAPAQELSRQARCPDHRLCATSSFSTKQKISLRVTFNALHSTPINCLAGIPVLNQPLSLLHLGGMTLHQNEPWPVYPKQNKTTEYFKLVSFYVNLKQVNTRD